MTGSWTVLGIPRALWHCQLDNFDYSAVTPKKLEEEVVKFQEGARSGKSPHLILTGDPAIGKSHLGVGLFRWGVIEFGIWSVAWVNVPEFCEKVKKLYGTDTDPFEDFNRATNLVVLDDVFGRDLSPHELGQILYRLIDTSYSNNAAVVINMNCALEDSKKYLRPHELSRILAHSTVIPMTGKKDWRR